jgi:hypothetical protein
MSSYTRKMTETIRIAENTKKLLIKEAHRSKYNEGAFDGFNMCLTLLTGLDYKTYSEVQQILKGGERKLAKTKKIIY